jgi:beta-lactamase regulating signal transducer with metallopeptidase domain
MTFYADAVSFAVRLAVNLLLIGSTVTMGMIVAFRLGGMTSARVRYIVAITIFFVAALLPIAATLNFTRAQESPPVAAATKTNYPNILSRRSQSRLAVQSSSLLEPFNVTSAALTNQVDSFIHLLTYSRLGGGFLVLWIAVAALLLGRESVGHVHLIRARRRWRLADAALRKQVTGSDRTLLYTDEHEGPCVVGLLRPVIVIPSHLFNQLSVNGLRCIVQHELSHARWRDPLANALLRMMRALLWPSLPLWYLERVARREREVAADRAAISSPQTQFDSDTAADYAAALILIAKHSGRTTKRPRYKLLATEISSSSLEHRVRCLLMRSPSPSFFRSSLAGFILSISIAGITFLPLASQPSRTMSLTIAKSDDDGHSDMAATEIFDGTNNELGYQDERSLIKAASKKAERSSRPDEPTQTPFSQKTAEPQRSDEVQGVPELAPGHVVERTLHSDAEQSIHIVENNNLEFKMRNNFRFMYRVGAQVPELPPTPTPGLAPKSK